MTARERVLAAINHQDGDRPPYIFEVCPDAHEALRAAGVMGDLSLETFLDNDIQDIHVPWWHWHELGPDWTEPDTPTSRATVRGWGSYDNLGDRVKALRDQSDKYFLLRIYASHFEKAYMARGIENFLADMAGDPSFARGLLNSVIEKNLVMLENVLSIAEIDGVLLGSDWGSQRGLLMRPSTWQEMIRPGEQREYDLIHGYGKHVWVHSCGDIVQIVPSLVEMGLDVLNPIQPEAMDIHKLKADFGGQLTFWGGLSTQQTLPFGTPEEVKAEARSLMRTMGDGGGYIFSPAQGIQGDVPVSNILALLEVAREGGS
ncbi:MAG TPA: uroporphyrinogen decarboxylase family protein [Armatimonadota bacterium]